ncbi:MAG: right-handed parallel beta-helix repeat-containing protein [Agriterribacter sp.]
MIKRKLPVLFIFFFLFCNAAKAQKDTFYISLRGNDAWSGTFANPASDNSDGPFRTFSKALQKMEALNTSVNQNHTFVFLVRGGDYSIDETIAITDKQTSEHHIHFVWKNYPGEKVNLVGAKPLTGFQHIKDPAVQQRIKAPYQQNILQVDLKQNGVTDFGEITKRGTPGLELFFNDKRMPLSQWPNKGWAKILDVPQSGNLVFPGELPHMRFDIPVGKHYGRFTYAEENPNHWKDIEHIILHGYWTWDWFDEYLGIQSIDTVTKEIFIRPPHSQYGLAKEQRYYALNILEELDEPGEWYINKTNGLLYFWPPADITTSTVFVSLLNTPLITLSNTDNITIQGLNFQFSREKGIEINGGKNNLIAGCSFNNLGNIAASINGGEKNGITSSDIYDMALGGITLSGGDRKTITPAANFVTNNHIHDIGKWMRTYQSAITVSGVGNYIAHNLIHDCPHAGILLTGNEHIIEYNDLHDLALETGDVGAFYMGRDWTERGNIIRYNYFHDLMGPAQHDVNAVYLDDWASGATVQGNIFSNCARGIMIGGGRDNKVDNNIFVGCKIALHIDSRGLGWAKYYFDGTDSTLFKRMDAMNFKQPPYSKTYPILLSLYKDEPAVAKNNYVTNNIAYKGKWLDLHDGLTLNIVHARHNILGDVMIEYPNKKDAVQQGNPGILNPEKADFRVDTKRMPFEFKPILYNSVGLQKNEYRTTVIKSFSFN